MIRIEVNIDDDQLMDSLAALARQGEDASPIMRGLAGIMRYADRYTGKTLNRTGDMRRSLSVRYGRDFALVGVNAPYAAAHQFGARTRPHIIRARSKKGLSFYGRNGEKLVRKVVHHPGSAIPPRPFLGVGEDHKAEMRRLIVRHLRKAVRGA